MNEQVGEVVPDLIQCVIGFRGWTLKPGAELWSCGGAVHVEWQPGTNQAVCHAASIDYDLWGGALPSSGKRPDTGDHRAPDPECGCGLYAMHDLSHTSFHWPVIGAVACWGQIEVHHRGFRAEYARVVALARGYDISDAVLLEVGGRYGAEVVGYGELGVAAREYGIAVPKDMRPERPAVRVVALERWEAASKRRPLPRSSSITFPTAEVTRLAEAMRFGPALARANEQVGALGEAFPSKMRRRWRGVMAFDATFAALNLISFATAAGWVRWASLAVAGLFSALAWRAWRRSREAEFIGVFARGGAIGRP